MHKLLKKLELFERFLEMSEKKYISTYISAHKQVLEKIYAGEPYILCTYYFPSEITAIFDIEFLYIERIVGLAVSCNIVHADNDNRNVTASCSYHTAFLELMEQNILPKPKRIIAVKYPCNDAVKLCEYLHNRYSIPIHYVSVDNLKDDLKSIFCVLYKALHIKQSIGKTIELSNQAVNLKRKIDGYRMEYPGIIKSDDCLKIFTVENDYGTSKAIPVLNELLQDIENKLKDYRHLNNLHIFWMGLIPLYNNSILSNVERQLPCKFVYEEMWMFGNYLFTHNDFFENLSNKVKAGLFYKTSHRINQLLSMINKTRSEIVINLSQENCSFLPPKVKQIEETFSKEGIKMYNISADVIKGEFHINTLINIIQNHVRQEGTND